MLMLTGSKPIPMAINVACLVSYALAIGPGKQSIIAALAFAAFAALLLHIVLLMYRRRARLASVERRAALIRAAAGHPECERLVLAALRTPLTDGDVVRVFQALCAVYDASGRSLVTRNAEALVTEFIAGVGVAGERR